MLSRLKKREWERRVRVTASADSVRKPAGAGHRRWGWVQEGEGGAKRRVGDARDPIRAGTRLPRKGGWIYYAYIENDIISYETPIAQALIGHKKGEVVDVELPAGTHKYEILDIKFFLDD